MVYKLISVQEIIAKVLRDNDEHEGDHRISDMIEYCGEALEKIGSFPQFVNKVTGKDTVPLTELSNYQARIPYDSHKIIQIAYANNKNGPFYPMRRASGSFDWGVLNDNTSDVDNRTSDSNLIILTMDLYDLTYEEARTKLNNEPDTASLLNGLMTKDQLKNNADSAGTSHDFTYIISDSFIKTNVKDGYLMVSYQAIPTDADGYPLIPDLISFKDALYWYINMKLLYPKWKLGTVRDAVYYDARRSWNYYCK